MIKNHIQQTLTQGKSTSPKSTTLTQKIRKSQPSPSFLSLKNFPSSPKFLGELHTMPLLPWGGLGLVFESLLVCLV